MEISLVNRLLYIIEFNFSIEAVGPIHAIPVRSDCPPMRPPPVPRIYHVDPVQSVQEPEEPALLPSVSGVETVEFTEESKSDPEAVKSAPEAVKSAPEAGKSVPGAELQVPAKRGAAGVADILMEDDVPVVEAAAPVVTKLGAAGVEEILMKEDAHIEAVEPVKTTPRDLLEDIKR
jgi:hypothetical protein